MNELHLKIVALDAGFGYTLEADGLVDGVDEHLKEHYSTEAEMKTRLGFVWQWWANQVNSE